MFNSTAMEIVTVIILILVIVRPNKIHLKIFGIFSLEAERAEKKDTSEKKLEEKNKKHAKEKED